MLEFFPYNRKSSNSWSFLDELCGFTYFDSVKNITFELIVLLIEKNKKNLNFQKPRLDQWKNSSSKIIIINAHLQNLTFRKKGLTVD